MGKLLNRENQILLIYPASMTVTKLGGALLHHFPIARPVIVADCRKMRGG